MKLGRETMGSAKASVTAALLFLTSQAHASERSTPNQTQTAPSARQPATIFFGEKHTSGWLPFEFWHGTRILIPIVVNGRQVRAFLDSGASEMILDRKFANALALRSVGTTTGNGVAGNGSSDVVAGVTVKLGDLTINTEKAIVVDQSQVEGLVGFPLPFVLGGQALRDTVIDIDFAKRGSPSSIRPRSSRQLALDHLN